MSQSKLYSRLRLNPVPESILSPDVPVPPNTRPAQMDDPVAARRIKGSRHHDMMNTKRQKDNTYQVIRIVSGCITCTHGLLITIVCVCHVCKLSSPQNGYTSSDVENTPNQRRSTKRNNGAIRQDQQKSEKNRASNSKRESSVPAGRSSFEIHMLSI